MCTPNHTEREWDKVECERKYNWEKNEKTENGAVRKKSKRPVKQGQWSEMKGQGAVHQGQYMLLQADVMSLYICFAQRN